MGEIGQDLVHELHSLNFVSVAYMLNFRPAVNILLVNLVGSSCSCSCFCCCRGKTESTPNLSRGLGLEFDNIQNSIGKDRILHFKTLLLTDSLT